MANNKGNAYKRLENKLYEYTALIVGIDNLLAEYQYKSLEMGSAITYDKEKVSPTHAFSSDTENIAIDLAEISKKIELLKLEKNAMDYALTTLSEEEKNIIELRYFKNYAWKSISRNFCCNEKTARGIRRDAMRKLSLALLGERL